MYKLEVANHVQQHEVKTLEDRLTMLQLLQKDQKKIAVSICGGVGSVHKFRTLNIEQALHQSNKWTMVYFFQHEVLELIDQIDDIAFLIINRLEMSQPLAELIEHAKVKEIKVVYSIDDWIVNLKDIDIIKNSSNANLFTERWASHIGYLNLSFQKCEELIVTNDYLRDKFTDEYQLPTYVIRNFIDQTLLEVSEFYQDKKTQNTGDFVIGYFSGSKSHDFDLQVVLPEILELMDKYDDIKLLLVGEITVPDYAYKYVKRGQIKRLGFLSELELYREIASVNVNIIPLLNNSFTNCKSELKFFDASILKTVTCATPTYVYKKVIKNGENGFLCRQSEWFGAIEKIYLKEVDEKKIVANAYNYCKREYYGDQVVYEIEQVFDKISEG